MDHWPSPVPIPTPPLILTLSQINRLNMAFVNAAERDEVACALATLLLADGGVKVDTAMIEKVGHGKLFILFVGPQDRQYHRRALLAHALRQIPR